MSLYGDGGGGSLSVSLYVELGKNAPFFFTMGFLVRRYEVRTILLVAFFFFCFCFVSIA